MSEKYFVVSESELERYIDTVLTARHAPRGLKHNLEEVKLRAEAACRSRPIPDEMVVKELHRLEQENRAMGAVVEAAIEEFNYKTQTSRISFPKFTRALAALKGDVK